MTQALLNIGDFVGYVAAPVVVKPQAKRFYLLRMHPNYDLKAERQLTERGVSVYVPKENRTLRASRGRKITRLVPIFSGALFVPDFEADLPRLKEIASGIGGWVRIGSDPLRISLAFMDEIRRFERRRMSESGDRPFKVGDRIRIISGPYALWEAKIERLDRQYRLRVLIDAVTREIPVDLGEDEVEAV